MAAFVNSVGDGIANRVGYKHEYNPKSYRGSGGLAGTYGGAGYSGRYDPIKLVDAICNPSNLSTFPSRQPFPVTAADLAAVIGGGLLAANVTEIWACDEASGDLTGKIAGTVLTAAGTPLYSRRTPGMIVQPVSGTAESASAWAYRNAAVELTADADRFTNNASPTIGDLTGAMTVLVIHRCRPLQTGAVRELVGRGTVAAGPFWSLDNSGASLSGVSRARIRNSASTDFISTGTTQVNDGAWHCSGLVYDGANVQVTTDGNLEGVLTAVAGTIDQANSLISIGQLPGIVSAVRAQVAYVVILNVALSAAQLANFWQYGKKPGGFANATTYTRAQRLGLVMGTFPGSNGAGDLACYYGANAPQFSWGAAPNAPGSNPLGVGLGSVTAKTNRILQSVNPTVTWALTGAALTPNSVTSPCGMLDAHQLVPIAATDKLEQDTGFAVPASGSFSFAIHMRRLAVSANLARLTIFGTTGGSVTATFAPTRNWDRFEINSGALPGALTGNIGVRIEPDITNGTATLVFWEPFGTDRTDTPSAVLDKDVMDIQSTTTAAVAGAATVLSLTSGVSVLVPQDFIRSDVRFSLPWDIANEPAASKRVFYLGDAAGNNSVTDRFNLVANVLDWTLNTNAVNRGTIRMVPSFTADTDHVTIGRARIFANFDGAHAAQFFVDGVKATTYTVDPVAPITNFTAAFARIDWGSLVGTSQFLDGIVYRHQVYREYMLTS